TILLNFADWFRLCLTCREQATTQFQLLRSTAIGEKTVIANPDKSARQDVEQKTPSEFTYLERHRLGDIACGIVFVAEGYLVISDLQQSSIGDCHAMSIACEVLQNLLWPTERRFGIDHPLDLPQVTQ